MLARWPVRVVRIGNGLRGHSAAGTVQVGRGRGKQIVQVIVLIRVRACFIHAARHPPVLVVIVVRRAQRIGGIQNVGQAAIVGRKRIVERLLPAVRTLRCVVIVVVDSADGIVALIIGVGKRVRELNEIAFQVVLVAERMPVAIRKRSSQAIGRIIGERGLFRAARLRFGFTLLARRSQHGAGQNAAFIVKLIFWSGPPK